MLHSSIAQHGLEQLQRGYRYGVAGGLPKGQGILITSAADLKFLSHLQQAP
jgi:hypothetical protein